MSNSGGYQLNKAATSHTLEDLRCHAPIAVSSDYESQIWNDILG